jgi:putative ABC transport system permease protein
VFGGAETQTFEVVGVVEDLNQRSLRHSASPIAFVPKYDVLQTVARIGERDVGGVLMLANRAWATATGLERAEVAVRSLKKAHNDAYQTDRDLMFSVLGFACVSILVAVLGVAGLSSLDVRRRISEIGLRKALGARSRDIRRLFISQTLTFAALASIASWPIGYWLALQWINSFAYRTPFGALALPATTLVIVTAAGMATILAAIHAAAISPSRALGAN